MLDLSNKVYIGYSVVFNDYKVTLKDLVIKEHEVLKQYVLNDYNIEIIKTNTCILFSHKDYIMKLDKQEKDYTNIIMIVNNKFIIPITTTHVNTNFDEAVKSYQNIPYEKIKSFIENILLMNIDNYNTTQLKEIHENYTMLKAIEKEKKELAYEDKLKEQEKRDMEKVRQEFIKGDNYVDGYDFLDMVKYFNIENDLHIRTKGNINKLRFYVMNEKQICNSPIKFKDKNIKMTDTSCNYIINVWKQLNNTLVTA